MMPMPIIAPIKMCVDETGSPKTDAAMTTPADESSAQKPLAG